MLQFCTLVRAIGFAPAFMCLLNLAYVETAMAVELNSRIMPFFSDSHAEFSMRNQFKNLNTEDSGQRQVQTAWGQGLTLDYGSGYMADIFGIDASYYQTLKLATSNDFAGRSILYNDRGKAKGFHKLGQLFAKVKLGNDTHYLKLYSSWQKIYNWGALTYSSRTVPSTYRGWRFDMGNGPFTLRGALVTRYSDRDSPKQIKFETADRQKKINQIYTVELLAQEKDYSMLYFIGESHHYLQRHAIEISWYPESLADKKFKASGMLYYNRALKDWRAMSANFRPFDNEAWHPAVYLEWQQNRWKHKIGAAYTRAKLRNRLGYFERHLTKNSRGTFNSMANAWGNDYLGDNEKMVAWTTEYSITPQLALGLQSGYGFGMRYQGQAIQRGEAILFSRWSPAGTKNLSIQFSVGPSWNYQHKYNRPLLTMNGKPKRAQNNAIEFQIDYTFGLL